MPGTSIVVRATQPAVDEVTIGLNGADRAISEKAAAGLFVKPE